MRLRCITMLVGLCLIFAGPTASETAECGLDPTIICPAQCSNYVCAEGGPANQGCKNVVGGGGGCFMFQCTGGC